MRQKHSFCCVWSREHWKSIATCSLFFMCLNEHGGEIIIRWTLVFTEVLLKFNDVVEFGTQPPTRITITRIRDKFEVDGTMQEREVPLITRVLMQACRYLHDPQISYWENVLVRLASRNPVFIEFWTRYQWYSISKNPDSMPLCSTSSLGAYCARLIFFNVISKFYVARNCWFIPWCDCTYTLVDCKSFANRPGKDKRYGYRI